MLDITLASSGLLDRIQGWKVPTRHSLYDDKCIDFSLSGVLPVQKCFRNPRRTNWEHYKSFLAQHVENSLSRGLPSSERELDLAVRDIMGLVGI